MQLKDDLYIYHIEKDTLEKISHSDYFSYSFADFIEDKIIFIGSSMAKYGINENRRIYLMDEAGKVKDILPSDLDLSIGNTVGTDCRYGSSKEVKLDGDYLYFITTEYGNAYLNRCDIKGNIERLTDKKGSEIGRASCRERV